MKQLTLKNYFLWGFAIPQTGENILSLQEWLSKLLLHGKESRGRIRFLKLLNDRVKEIDDERKKLIEENAKKNKEGKTIYIDEKNKETTTPTQQIKLKEGNTIDKDFGDYLNEDFVLDVSPSNSETIYTTRDIILNTNEEFKGTMAMRHSEWCDAFEGIKEEGEKTKKEEVEK